MTEPNPQAQDELTFTNAPNILTLIRITFVPLVVGLLFIGEPNWDAIAAVAFGIASITDFFDGYLARRHQQVTIYGKLMDPLADKFLVVSSVIMLQHLGRIHPVVVMLLVCRELGITGLRALASAEGVVIAASEGAKWKTATQMIAIPFIMAGDAWLGLPLYPIGIGLLYLSLALSLWSAKDYVVGFFKGLQLARKERNLQRRHAREARRLARAARLAAKAGDLSKKT
ncbi:MAG: CDP-diacylglycerol--glycerol-3-phosphate 3-phosphatidyltransferase [Oligoflexia bacterium]|nr:CDP-diacylglycerol--glycerol-3-phosphate 3-phosphatidyltransferase [Oligoflexia bacterium]